MSTLDPEVAASRITQLKSEIGNAGRYLRDTLGHYGDGSASDTLSTQTRARVAVLNVEVDAIQAALAEANSAPVDVAPQETISAPDVAPASGPAPIDTATDAAPADTSPVVAPPATNATPSDSAAAADVAPAAAEDASPAADVVPADNAAPSEASPVGDSDPAEAAGNEVAS